MSEYPELAEFLGANYHVNETTFRLPNTLANNATLLQNCGANNTNEKSSGATSMYLAQTNLPNVDLYTLNDSTNYPNYRGKHKHRWKFSSTHKSGTDTMTVLSYSENKGTYAINTCSSNDSYKGRHQHKINLNTGTQAPLNLIQRTGCFGNYYIYAGDI